MSAESNLAECRGKIADEHNVRQGEGIVDKVGAALQPLFKYAQRLCQPHLFRRCGLQCKAGDCVSRGLSPAVLPGEISGCCKLSTLHVSELNRSIRNAR